MRHPDYPACALCEEPSCHGCLAVMSPEDDFSDEEEYITNDFIPD